jgi:predicted RNase H-like nuclease (RuvC/YqgF family)
MAGYTEHLRRKIESLRKEMTTEVYLESKMREIDTRIEHFNALMEEALRS